MIGAMRSLVLAVLVVALGSACAASEDGTQTPTQAVPEETVSGFFSRQIEYGLWGQHGRAWDRLHPGQQALVPRAKYVECQQKTRDIYPSLEVKSVEVLRTYNDSTDVVGIPESVTTAVKMRVTISDPGVRNYVSTDTVHTVDVDGRFVWILPAAAVRAFEAGRCPAN